MNLLPSLSKLDLCAAEKHRPATLRRNPVEWRKLWNVGGFLSRRRDKHKVSQAAARRWDHLMKLEGSLITASAVPLRQVYMSKYGDICRLQIKIYLRKYERRKWLQTPSGGEILISSLLLFCLLDAVLETRG